MSGVLGQPYKFIYSSKGLVSGLTDILALVKYPDGTAKGTYALSELSGSIFQGFYSFDLTTTQNDPEGEYGVVIYEQTSGHREHGKTEMRLPAATLQQDLNPELFATMKDEKINGWILDEPILSGKLESSELSAKIVSDSLSATMTDEKITAKISEDILIAKLLECA